MIIAPNFVFVHLSKTGGTFAEETLQELFCPSALGRKLHFWRTYRGLRLPFYKYRYDQKRQHALCNDIPETAREKPILSCIRNPFDLYVSEYAFDWWKRYPDNWFYDFPAFAKLYPNWRDLSFEDFMSVSNRHSSWVQRTLVKFPKADRLGWYSHKFVYYYCRDHDYVFDGVENSEVFVERVKETMYPVHFIHTDSLNKELFEFLLSKGYPKELIEMIPAKDKVNASRKSHDYRQWYSDRLKGEVEERDALIFRLFPRFRF
jgi:hypothetical protein